MKNVKKWSFLQHTLLFISVFFLSSSIFYILSSLNIYSLEGTIILSSILAYLIGRVLRLPGLYDTPRPRYRPNMFEVTAISAVLSAATVNWFVNVPPPTTSGPPLPVATPTVESTPGAGISETPTPEGGPTTPSLPAVGRFEATYPLTMTVEDYDLVTVEIIADPNLSALDAFAPLASGVIRIERTSQQGERRRIERQIRLYPRMSVELEGDNFTTTKPLDPEQRLIRRLCPIGHTAVMTMGAAHIGHLIPVVGSYFHVRIPGSAVWTWSISPQDDGPQPIT